MTIVRRNGTSREKSAGRKNFVFGKATDNVTR